MGVISALRDDAIVSTYREHGHALTRGMSPGSVMAEMFGKQEGCSRGRGGSMHLFDAKPRFYGGNAVVAGGIPVAVGFAWRTKCGPAASDMLRLRRRSGSRRRISRIDELGRAVEASGAVSCVKTTCTPWGRGSTFALDCGTL